MNSLLKKVNLSNKKTILLRDSLQRQLNTCVMEMQSAPGVLEGKSVTNCEETMALCSVLEAIFLHGLKDSLLNRVTEALSGPDFDAMPQPSFWAPLLIFSHRQTIEQIQALLQVTTEVGYCRAWIRLTLNEGILASYLASIRRDTSALNPYYDRSAFIRDSDLLEITQRLVENMDYIKFELACNTSLLNFWSSTPLLMAGIWSPPMKSCPVVSAVDIAKTLNSDANDTYDEIETASSIGSLGSFNSSLSMYNNMACFSEEDALNLILRKGNQVNSDNAQSSLSGMNVKREKKEINLNEDESKEESRLRIIVGKTSENRNENLDNNELERESGEEKQETSDTGKVFSLITNDMPGNSLIRRTSWSTSQENVQSPLTSSMISQNSDTRCTPGEGPTYDALIKSYNPAGYSSSPNLQELIDTYPVNQAAAPVETVPIHEKMSMSFDEQLGRIPREKGLDTQNYSCLNCGQSIGLTFAKAHVCSFSGEYYCGDCMSSEQFLIPSRIIHNWDLRLYPVCQRAATYLSNCSKILDLKKINPKIYSAVEPMAQLQSLRVQLNFLKAYLITCREPVFESLKKKISPRDYLYEHIHQYSLSDLLNVPDGTLMQQLQKIVEFARNHVTNCWLCSQKGFICEVCKSPKVIYPFDIETTYRCGACNAVFHSDCLNSKKPCPKCERRRKRTDLNLPEVSDSESKTELLSSQ